MKRKLIASLCLGIAIIGGIVSASHRKVAAKPAEKITPACFTRAAVNYPLPAPSTAPVTALNPNADSRQLYAQISVLTRPQRKKFFEALSGVNKAKVWLVHFQTYKIDHALTFAQQAFIDEYVAALTDADLDRDKASFKARFPDYKQQSIDLFTRPEAWELMDHLGGKSPFADNQQLTNFSINGTTLWNVPDCECTMDAWCQWIKDQSYSCMWFPGACVGTPMGCGVMWLDPCTGRCI